MAEPSVDPSYLLRAVRTFVGGVVSESPRQGDPAGGAEDQDALGFEEAGCLVWDVAALPDDAAFLLQHNLPAMLQPLLVAAAAGEQWRALEIGLGTLGNLACHEAVLTHLLQQEGLPDLLLSRLLWVDDTASLAELCRCLAGLLSGQRKEAEPWWTLLLTEETLGRLVWILENTLSSLLLERTINLLSAVLATAAAAAADGNPGKQAQLVPLLLSLDVLPLLASVLLGWVARLRSEQRQFDGGDALGSRAAGSAGSSRGASASASPTGWGSKGRRQKAGGEAADKAAAGPVDDAGAAAGASEQVVPAQGGGHAARTTAHRDTTTAAAAAAEPEPEPAAPLAAAAAAAGGGDDNGDDVEGPSGPTVAAAEVTEAAALEALGLLEGLVPDAAGEQALSASADIQEALLHILSESEHRGMQAASTTLLAGLDGVGARLLQHPKALAAVLAQLAAAAAAGQPAQTGSGAAQAASMAGGGEQQAVGQGEQEQDEGVVAAWALCSSLAHALVQQLGAAAELDEHARKDQQDVLAHLDDHIDVLCHDWGGRGGSSVCQHQAYALQRLAPLLVQRSGTVGEQQAAALQVALVRCQPSEQQQ